MQLPLFPQIRPCHLYEDEYDDCTSIRARFQQYFVLGQWEDCTPWKHDYYNCEKWKNNKDKAAASDQFYQRLIIEVDFRVLTVHPRLCCTVPFPLSCTFSCLASTLPHIALLVPPQFHPTVCL
ncbi:hypothetical protein J6590_048896 [Homalodisca vitripennis]|nr:hypothetical protein J6590_048896 [Homalodisca vitripennis]